MNEKERNLGFYEENKAVSLLTPSRIPDQIEQTETNWRKAIKPEPELRMKILEKTGCFVI